jgi:hypothetical protein
LSLRANLAREAGDGAWSLATLIAIFLAVVAVVAPNARASELKYISTTKTVTSTLPTGHRGNPGTATCPAGHPHVTGGGFNLTGDNSDFELSVATMVPAFPSGASAWLGEANNTSGSDAQMTTTAICAKGSFKYPEASKNISPGGQGTKKVSCPPGTKVTGGGLETAPNSPRAEVVVSRPFDGPDGNSTPDDGWLGTENNGTHRQGSMSVQPVCAKSGDYKYVRSAPKPLPDDTEASARASCPDGTIISGGGVENSGTGVGAGIESTFPSPQRDWVGRANNDHTGHAETVQAFAICRVEEIRKFSGAAGGGTVNFKTKFEDGKTVKVLPHLTFNSVPIHCSNGDTVHGVTFDNARRVRHNAFGAHDVPEVGAPQASFSFAGSFNHDGTRASGTYREHGNLKSSNGTFVFRHCDTGTVHWSADVTP